MKLFSPAPHYNRYFFCSSAVSPISPSASVSERSRAGATIGKTGVRCEPLLGYNECSRQAESCMKTGMPTRTYQFAAYMYWMSPRCTTPLQSKNFLFLFRSPIRTIPLFPISPSCFSHVHEGCDVQSQLRARLYRVGGMAGSHSMMVRLSAGPVSQLNLQFLFFFSYLISGVTYRLCALLCHVD